jgi:hypothetical protein
MTIVGTYFLAYFTMLMPSFQIHKFTCYQILGIALAHYLNNVFVLAMNKLVDLCVVHLKATFKIEHVLFNIIPYSFCGYSWLALAYQFLKLFFYLNICKCETSFQRSLDFCATMYNWLIDLPFIQHGMENFWAFASLSIFKTFTLLHIHSIVEFSNFVQCSQFKNNLIKVDQSNGGYFFNTSHLYWVGFREIRMIL